MSKMTIFVLCYIGLVLSFLLQISSLVLGMATMSSYHCLHPSGHTFTEMVDVGRHLWTPHGAHDPCDIVPQTRLRIRLRQPVQLYFQIAPDMLDDIQVW